VVGSWSSATIPDLFHPNVGIVGDAIDAAKAQAVKDRYLTSRMAGV
jgi:hypothetical protein